MRKVWKILIGVVVCLVVLVAVLLLSIDSIVKTALEKGASAILQAETTVKAVDVGMASGSAKIEGLKIANPKDYLPGDFFELGKIDVGLKVSSLLSDTVQVDRIVIEAPVIRLKQRGFESNLQAILRAASGEGAAPAEGAPAKEAPKAEAKGKKFKIGVIEITDAQIEYRIGEAPAVRAPLPYIKLTELSNADGSPMMLKDVIFQIFSAMAKSAGSALKGLPGDVKGALGSAAGVGEVGVKKAVEGTTQAVKGAGEAVKGAGDALKGLFKKDEKTE